MIEIDSKKVYVNMLWRFFERAGAQGISFIVSIILARILGPHDYGVVAIVIVFTSILNSLVDSGLGNSLIQKIDADDLDFATVFHFNIFFSLILYFLLYIFSPYIAAYFGYNELTKVLRVSGIIIIIYAVKNVEQSYATKYLLFKKFFFSTIVGTIIAGIVGVYLAKTGYGVWSLVVQLIVNNAIDTIILWFLIGYRYKCAFSINRLIVLLKFGIPVLLASLCNSVYDDLRKLVIAKNNTPKDLAYYTKADQWSYIFVSNINSTIESVIFPSLSAKQDNIEMMKRMLKRSLKMSYFLLTPIFIGIFVIADKFIICLYTNKWLDSIVIVRILCIAYIMWPIYTNAKNVVKAVGKGNLFLFIEIVNKLVGVFFIILAMNKGIVYIAYFFIFTLFFNATFTFFFVRKILRYGYLELFLDIYINIVFSILMGIFVYFVGILFKNQHYIFVMFLQVFVGIFIYFFMNYISKNESYIYLLNMIKPKTPK